VNAECFRDEDILVSMVVLFPAAARRIEYFVCCALICNRS